MVYAVEVWTIYSPDDEEAQPTEIVDCQEFESLDEAKDWAWERMEEGYYTRMWRR